MLSRPSTLHSAAPGVGLSVVRLRIVRPLALLKRSGDLCFALALLTLGSPLLIAIAIAVKCTSQGPVFFVQQRIGRGYRRFGCIKFRTMELDADRRLQSLLASCPQLRAEFEKDHKLRNDPRITPIGQFLRTTSLDELPQLLNVLNGEMSLIGPRPERPELEYQLECCIPHYRKRHWMRPGLSGWAQVCAPYASSIEDSDLKLSYDLYYLRHFSTWLDLVILFRTVKTVLKAGGR